MTAVKTADPCISTEAISGGGALIRVDLTEVESKKAARQKLEAITAKAESLSARNPKLRHLVVLLHGARLPESDLMPLAGRIAQTLHQHLETARGAYVAVTALVDSPPVPPELLQERLAKLARCAPGMDPAVALSTQEIVGEEITQASVDEIV
ncbi:MAG: hypothetical protein IR160_07195 [Salinibacterium sp.]|nr:hypothetical protein [Salinibacterium sp.]MBF0672353.1 hypothetical protein [Salinibacterium sp.]